MECDKLSAPITVPLLTASLSLAEISSEMLPASLETDTFMPQAAGSKQMAASKKISDQPSI